MEEPSNRNNTREAELEQGPRLLSAGLPGGGLPTGPAAEPVAGQALARRAGMTREGVQVLKPGPGGRERERFRGRLLKPWTISTLNMAQPWPQFDFV